MLERASWGAQPDPWQEQGRYRSSPESAALVAERQAAEQRLTRPVTDPGPAGEGMGDPAQHAAPSEPPLYAWDGGVVDGSPEGRVQPQGGTPRGVEAPPAGRAHIIELYQQVLDERDALAEEVESLRRTLDATQQALQAKSAESESLAMRLEALDAAHKELMGDNQAIAARLVQAQIRRLEAEKLLLETHIDSERARAEELARTATPASKSSSRRRAGDEEGHE